MVYQIFPIMSIISLPLSGILYVTLGYISKKNWKCFQLNVEINSTLIVLELLLICLFMNACGIIYAIYYLKEIPQRQIEIAELEPMNQHPVASENIKDESRPQVAGKVKCSEIFNFRILRDSLGVVIRKRKYNGRTVVVSLFLMTVIYNGIFSGETKNLLHRNIDWNKTNYSFFRRRQQQLLLRSDKTKLGSDGRSSLCCI